MPVRLVDCKYQNCDISAEANAGGFVGKQANSVFSANVGEGDGFFGQSSTVRATSRWNGGECCTAGGLLGLTAADVQIGKTTTSAKPLMLTDVVVTSDKTDGTFANTRGIGGILGRAEHVVSVKHVSISSTKNAGDNDTTYIGSKNAAANRSNDDEGNNRYGSAGGIGGIVGTAANGDVAVDDCRVSSVLFAVRECAGGILGTIADGKTLTATNIVVDSIQIDGAYSAGVLGQAKGNSNTTIVANAVVKNSTFKKKANWWNHPEGHNTYSGGIVGDTKGAIKMSNILVSKNTFKDKQYQGLLFGDVPPSEEGGGGVTGIYVAGLNVELKEGEKNTDTPNLMHYRKASVVGAVNKKSYIAFGDYNGTNRNETMAGKDGSILYNDERDDSGNMPAVESASPYVTTSPVSSLQVRAAKDADAKSVFSDGAASYVDRDGKTKLLAGKIANEATAGSSSDGKYTYTNIGGIDKDGNYQNSASYNPQTADSTFNANNTAVGSNRVDDGADFPVLLIPGNDTTTVESYLNVVTNGGFSDARRLNGSSKSSDSHVTATAETFELQEIGEEGNKTKAFVKAAGSPSLSVVSDGTSSMAFRASSDWDNEKSRFTLLTVTLNEASGSYKVQVPIIVKRMLEIDFTATYSEGTNFKAAEYDTFGKHVLISGGEAMTGYLTWTYNQALGTPTEYGWNTHLASGGAMKPLNKTIEFKGTDAKGTLPRGTQLTLVDTTHGSKEYHCTVGYDDVSGASVKLTQFKDAEDHAYEEQWLSETAGVTATEDTSGAWVKLSKQDDNAQAGVKVSAGDNQGYYRQKTAADTEGTFYTLTVSDEAPKSENFYLIVRTPKDISTSVNGYTATSVTTTVNTNINYKLRVKDKNGNL